VGVVGPWGSGKTSIVNMIRQSLEVEPAIAIVEFNPWIFSGTDELVESFFRELSAQMRLKEPKIAAIAETVDTYGDLLSPASALPVVGAWLDRVRGSAKALKVFQEKRKGSIAQQRDMLAKELAGLLRPIVVVIDDIDRLESSEIRDIFKLVRLTASFPNVVYLLAFDRARVEDALLQSGFDGRAYLEKIMQLGVDLPIVLSATAPRLPSMWESSEALWRRLNLGRAEYLQRLIATLIVGGDQPAWNTPRSPSERGGRFLRLLDEIAHDDGPGAGLGCAGGVP